jgi:hypothetical protein
MSLLMILFGFNGRLAGTPFFSYRLLMLVMMMLPVSSWYLVYVPAQANAEEMLSGGALSFFADEEDARILLGRLNGDREIAFIVPDGPRLPQPNERMPASPRGDWPPKLGAYRDGDLRLGLGRLLAAVAGAAACGQAKGWRAHSLAHFRGTAACQR